MKRDIDLVIFDCDGVLVDSEPLSCRIRAEWLTEVGYPISADEVTRRFIGVSERDLRREIEAEIGRALPPDEHETRLKALLEEGLAPVAGMAVLLGDVLGSVLNKF
ncbi:MAG TPA: HAD family phosphatase [Hyphomicrobiales bacterium]|nr:HAD family phosphatase [Hyphomicrobiales bacterium]